MGHAANRDRLDEGFVQRGYIDDGDKAFIEKLDMFFLATVDAEGHPQCSYKGGDPGLVRVVDEHTLAFPNYDRQRDCTCRWATCLTPATSGCCSSIFAANPPRRLRANGTASIHKEDPLLGEWERAQFIVRVRVSEVFPNCPRYIHRMELVERSEFVPRDGCEPPVPAWKRAEWARDALPARDSG